MLKSKSNNTDASERECSREASLADPQAVRGPQPGTVRALSPLRIPHRSPPWVLGLALLPSQVHIWDRAAVVSHTASDVPRRLQSKPSILQNMAVFR